MKQILVLEHHDETAHCLCFLLRLAGFTPMRTHNEQETINWVGSRKRVGDPFDLLLISNTSPSFPPERLLAELREAGASLPVLVIDRSKGTDMTGSNSVSGLPACSSSEVIASVQELFRNPGISCPGN